MFRMPFFHRVIILLYQSENIITSVVFRYAAERKKESILSSSLAFTYGTISSILVLHLKSFLLSCLSIHLGLDSRHTSSAASLFLLKLLLYCLQINKTAHYKCPRCGGQLTKG